MKEELKKYWQQVIPETYHGYFDNVYTYFETILETNQKVNFFSRKMDPIVFFQEHIVDSALALKYIQDYKVILDFGTGGGLPGVVLACCEPNKRFFLLDKSQKKIHYLKEMIENVGLLNCTAHSEAFKEVKSIDLVVSRAVGSIDSVSNKLKTYQVPAKSPVIMYKGTIERIEEELKEFPKRDQCKIIKLENPFEKQRHLLLYSF